LAVVEKTKEGLQRRVAGYHDIRMDGMTDLVMRANGASVFDIGCNRGLVSFEMANNGAAVCHGCDSYAEGIQTARELFADLRAVESHFAVIDLAEGPNAIANEFGAMQYDIVLCLATYHKLKRIMTADALDALFVHFGQRTRKYFGWRGTGDKPQDNEEEIKQLDVTLGKTSLKRMHTSYISQTLGVAAIWSR
jgi:SAM-dependent methyltransferase